VWRNDTARGYCGVFNFRTQPTQKERTGRKTSCDAIALARRPPETSGATLCELHSPFALGRETIIIGWGFVSLLCLFLFGNILLSIDFI